MVVLVENDLQRPSPPDLSPMELIQSLVGFCPWKTKAWKSWKPKQGNTKRHDKEWNHKAALESVDQIG
jgi:hypothetical protein